MASVKQSMVAQRRAVLRGGETELYGRRPLLADDGDSDPGLCGPGSVSWKVFNDPSAAVATIRSFQVQAAHPKLVVCLAEHGTFADDPRRRYRANIGFQLLSTFGTTQQVSHVARHVNAVHATMSGTIANGEHYRADDDELLWWAHAATVTSAATCWNRFGPGEQLTERELDRLVVEQGRSVALLGLGDIPATWCEMTEGMRARSPQLEIEAPRSWFHERNRDVNWPTAWKPIHQVLHDAAATTLEPWLAEAAELRVGKRRDRIAARLVLRQARIIMGADDLEPCEAAKQRVRSGPASSET